VSATGKITKNRWTKEHPENLRKLGYEVDEDSDPRSFIITCEGFVTGTLDLTKDAKAKIKQIVKEKKLITYGCKLVVPGKDKPVFRTEACKWLDQNVMKGLSCLVATKSADGTSGGKGLESFLDDDESDKKEKEPSLSDFADDSPI
jgi:hypothetical protein